MNQLPEHLPSHRPEPEIVLPNGTFVKLRRITWYDWLICISCSQGNMNNMPLAIAHRCCTFDGKAMSLNELHQLDIDDFMPVLKMIDDQINSSQKNKGGVA